MGTTGEIFDVSHSLSQTSECDIQNGPILGQMKIMVVDKSGYSDHILDKRPESRGKYGAETL